MPSALTEVRDDGEVTAAPSVMLSNGSCIAASIIEVASETDIISYLFCIMDESVVRKPRLTVRIVIAKRSIAPTVNIICPVPI
jgi:hypothetical protein